jgi:hypothetical protein
LHAAAEEPRKAIKREPEQGGALAETAFQNNVDGELFEAVEGGSHKGADVAGFRATSPLKASLPRFR